MLVKATWSGGSAVVDTATAPLVGETPEQTAKRLAGPPGYWAGPDATFQPTGEGQPYCPDCHHWVGSQKACKKTLCKACGTLQCMSFGTGKGACGVCLYGLLEGWSGCDGICSYKGCGEPAIAQGLPRKPRVCAEHARIAKVRYFGTQITLYVYINQALGERNKRWTFVPA